MCGVPHHARNAYLSKLIRQGCKVAICEQIEEPGQKGIFRREVTEVVTPGLVFSEECLDSRGNNFLAAVRFVAPFACAALDATTGEFFHEACDTEEALADALFRIAPAEFVALEGEGNPTTSRGKRLLEGKLLTLLSPTAVAAFPPPPGIGGIPPADHPSGGVVRAALYYLFLHQPAALSEIGRVTEREGRRYLAIGRDRRPDAGDLLHHVGGAEGIPSLGGRPHADPDGGPHAARVARRAASRRRADRGAARRGGGASRGARDPQVPFPPVRRDGGPLPARLPPGAGPFRPPRRGGAARQPGGDSRDRGRPRGAARGAPAVGEGAPRGPRRGGRTGSPRRWPIRRLPGTRTGASSVRGTTPRSTN